MDKQRMAILFDEECRLFWEFVLMKLHIRKATDEDKIRWRKDWRFVTDEIRRLKNGNE